METLFARRPVTVTLPIVLLVSLVILTLAWPEGVKAAFQGVATFAQRIWVGEFTAVEPIDPDRITVLEDGRLMMPGTRVDEEITAADQVVGQGGWRHEISVQRFDTITAAREAVAFPLLQPAYLPAGYALSGANVWGSGANAYVFFNYEGADGKIGLSQRPVGGAGGQTVSIGLPDDYVIEKVVLNGIEALWAEHVLLWEVDGISYLVSSPDISQEEIIRIAESLE